jgi:hypothetical protein
MSTRTNDRPRSFTTRLACALVLVVLASTSCEPRSASFAGGGEAVPARVPAMPQVGVAFGPLGGNDGAPYCPPPGDPCPADLPDAGSACGSARSCIYADASAPPECAVTAWCSTWSVDAAATWSISGLLTVCEARPHACPHSFAAAAAARDDAGAPPACDGGLRCEYSEGICGCDLADPGDGGAYDYAWICSDPTPGCPAQRPVQGTPCDGGSTLCEYAVNRGCGGGGPLGGTNAVCSCGEWQWRFPVECPNP